MKFCLFKEGVGPGLVGSSTGFRGVCSLVALLLVVAVSLFLFNQSWFENKATSDNPLAVENFLDDEVLLSTQVPSSVTWLEVKPSPQQISDDKRNLLSSSAELHLAIDLAEEELIEYLQSESQEDSAKCQLLYKSLATIEQADSLAPGHLRLLTYWMRTKLHLPPPEKPLVPIESAFLSYLLELPNLSEELQSAMAFRRGQRFRYSPIILFDGGSVNQFTVDNQLKLLHSIIGKENLKGLTLVDIGGGTGQFCASASHYLGGGKVICVESSSAYGEYAKIISKTFPEYRAIQFRTVSASSGDTSLRPQEANIIWTYDVNNLSDYSHNQELSSPEIRQSQEARHRWLKEVYQGLKVGGHFIYYDSFVKGSGNQLLSLLKQHGFIVKVLAKGNALRDSLKHCGLTFVCRKP